MANLLDGGVKDQEKSEDRRQKSEVGSQRTEDRISDCGFGIWDVRYEIWDCGFLSDR